MTRLDKLAPESALLHPVWLLGVLVLALNDHGLKGSGLMPYIVTGKLSDVAGLLVAPILLAAVLALVFGVRTRKAIAICHVATGVGFALIQLSAAAADGLCAAMGWLGIAWQIWPDPTDLLALPALWLSWRWLVPVAAVTAPERRRLVIQGAAVAGLIACGATSRVPAASYPSTTGQQVGDVFLHNASAGEPEVHMAYYAETIEESDCGRLVSAPPTDSSVYARYRRWRVPSGANMPLWDRQPGRANAPCYAVSVALGSGQRWIVAWSADQVPVREISASGMPGDSAGIIELQQVGDGWVLSAPYSVVLRTVR